MSGWGIFGLIFGIAAALCLVVLLLPLRFTLRVDAGNTTLALRLLGFNLLRPAKKPKSDNGFKNQVRRQVEQTKKTVREDGLVPAVKSTFHLLNALLKILKKAVSRVTVKRLYLTAIPAGNAAVTALEYGAVCAAVYPATALLRAKLRFAKNAENIEIKCDFEAEQPCFRLDFEARLRVVFALAAALSLGCTLKENKKRGKKK